MSALPLTHVTDECENEEKNEGVLPPRSDSEPVLVQPEDLRQDLPSSAAAPQVELDSFSCTWKLHIGRLIIYEDGLEFKAHVGGTKVILRGDGLVKSMAKTSTGGLFPTALTLRTVDGRKLHFHSFLSRDSCYNLIKERTSLLVEESDSSRQRRRRESLSVSQSSDISNVDEILASMPTDLTLRRREAFGLPASELWKRLLSDEAVFCRRRFLIATGEENVQLSPWTSVDGLSRHKTRNIADETESKSSHEHVSNAHDGDSDDTAHLRICGVHPDDLTERFGGVEVETRVATFDTKLKSSLLKGRPASVTRKQWHLQLQGQRMVHIWVIRTKVTGAPYADCFEVLERWCLIDTGEKSCELVIHCGAQMLKKTLFRSKIEAQSQREVDDSLQLWLDHVKPHVMDGGTPVAVPVTITNAPTVGAVPQESPTLFDTVSSLLRVDVAICLLLFLVYLQLRRIAGLLERQQSPL
ncbi:MAG: hypothetical protein MHM6MM_003849 [Cercozoa sp. M6MM]